MKRRKNTASVAANPILIGAVTTVVIIVAVFLAYNANKGLPFVPTFTLNVETQNAKRLVVGNEVREGGERIGIVSAIKTIKLPQDKTGAELKLQLDRKYTPVPSDTRYIIRSKGTLGLKYVDQVRGQSPKAYRENAVVPAGPDQSTPELDDFFSTFDEPTRENIRLNLDYFASAFAGRGVDLNRTFSTLPQLLGDLVPVMQTLSRPSNDLRGFINELADFTRITAPVAGDLSDGFTTAGDTFEAFSRDPNALDQTIAQSPETLDTAIRELPVGRQLFRALVDVAPATTSASAELRRSAPPISRALAVGTTVLPKTVRLSKDLTGSLRSLGALGALAARQPDPGRPADDHGDREPHPQVPRAPRDRLQLLELLLDVHQRPPRREGQHRDDPAHRGQADAAGPDERARRLRGDRTGQRPAVAAAARQRPRGAARPALRPCGRRAGQRRLRAGAAWLPRAPSQGRPGGVQHRRRRADPGQPGADLHRQAPRPRRADLQCRAGRHRPVGAPMRLFKRSRRRRSGPSPVIVALGVIALLVIGSFLAVTKDIPFVNEPYVMKAAFKDSDGIKPGSPVREAGVAIGEVTKVEPTQKGGRAAVVTMAITKNGLPIKTDATLKIRPRIFLEGNFVVEVSPGRPGSPALPDGGMIASDHTANPVQFDQVLLALKSDVRDDLRNTFAELSVAEGAGAAKAFNRSLKYQPAAYKFSAIVAEALLGEQPHDLSKWIAGQGIVFSALDRDPAALRGLIDNFNTTTAAIADRQADLRSALQELPVTLRTALPTLSSLNAAFPPVRRFATAALPGVKSTGPTVDALLPFIKQLRGLVQPSELRGLSADLRASTPPLASFARTSVPLLGELRTLASCVSSTLVPYGNQTLTDPNFPAAGRVYEEFPKSLVGLAGESRSNDANGQCFKVLGSGGLTTVDLGNGLLGAAAQPMQGVNPPPQRTLPPLMADAPCENQELPDLRTTVGAPPKQTTNDPNDPEILARIKKAQEVAVALLRSQLDAAGQQGPGPRQGGHPQPAGRRAQGDEGTGGPRMILTLRKNFRYIVALLLIAALALGVAAYVTAKQGARIPFLSPSPVRITATLDTAQAITPGQGQSVQVAGVKVGNIADVKLVDGRAELQLDIEPKWIDRGLIKTDATALLRPRTPLKDMYLQVFPGDRDGGKPIKKGFSLPLRNTLTDVNLDEILSALDGRTRDYITLLLNGAATGLKGRGGDLAEVFNRFEPTVQDLGPVNRAVASERVALRSLVSALAGSTASWPSARTS